ncbi:MAG: hypothetical protein AAGI38_07085 [Bacteroidota bacterium]
MSTPESHNSHELQFDNDVRKLRLLAQYGVEVQTNGLLPPEFERLWLDELEDINEKAESKDGLSVFRYIGSPKYIPTADELFRTDVPEELTRLLLLLKEHHIEVQSDRDVDPRELYRFITEEVFTEEVDQIPIQTKRKRYCYDDYHPDLQGEVRRSVTFFLNKLFEKQWKLVEGMLAQKVQAVKMTPLNREVFLEKLMRWFNTYQNPQLCGLGFEKVKIEQEEAFVTTVISFWAKDHPEEIEVRVNFRLMRQDRDLWSISGVFIPWVH